MALLSFWFSGHSDGKLNTIKNELQNLLPGMQKSYVKKQRKQRRRDKNT